MKGSVPVIGISGGSECIREEAKTCLESRELQASKFPTIWRARRVGDTISELALNHQIFHLWLPDFSQLLFLLTISTVWYDGFQRGATRVCPRNPNNGYGTGFLPIS
jgi:hypothetical protein